MTWNDEDALPFPFCLSAVRRSEGNQAHVSVARGNIVLADHGLTCDDESLGTVPEPFLFMPPASGGDRCAPSEQQPIFPRFRPRLAKAPLTHAGPPYDHELAARAAMQWSLRDVQPAIMLTDSNRNGALDGAPRSVEQQRRAPRSSSPRSTMTARQ